MREEEPVIADALHQITLGYSPIEDRMTLRIRTTGGTEFRLGFTRRFVRVLWGALEKMIHADPELQRQLEPSARDAVAAFEHQDAVNSSDFSQKHQEDAENFPLGEEPILIVGGNCSPSEGGITKLSLKTKDGRQVAFGLNKQLLHALCHLLITTSAKAGWDLALSVGEGNVVLNTNKEDRVVH
ncbi:MAG: hypothetical protein ACPGOV_16350 [Magnetovibrionaceae bacterium]